MSRFDFKPFTEEGRGRFQAVLNELRDLEAVLEEMLPDGREKALVFTKMEEAAHWCCMAIVRGQETTTND